MKLLREAKRQWRRRSEPAPQQWRVRRSPFKHAPAQMRRFRYLVVSVIMLQMLFAARVLGLFPGPLG